MKNTLFLFILFFITSCKSQEVIIDDAYKKDIILWSSKDNLEINYIKNNIIPETGKILKTRLAIKEIYNNSNMILLTYRRVSDFMAIEKHYSFIKESDTMNISCRCGQERNYYFKNLVFKKGNYELKFNEPNSWILGNTIDSSKKLHNFLFKNTYLSDEKPTQKDKYFKDLKFIEVDLNDTINVKLTEIKTSANKGFAIVGRNCKVQR